MSILITTADSTLPKSIKSKSMGGHLLRAHCFSEISPPHFPCLAALIYLMEGIRHWALALVISLYCNLFPSPDVALSKHGEVHPQTHIQTYQMLTTCWREPGPTEVTGTVGDTSEEFWRRDRGDRSEWSRQTDGHVRHMLRQLTTPTWPAPVRGDRGHPAMITPTNVVTAATFISAVF